MNLPLAIGWGLLGLVAGFVLNLVSRWLAGVEEIEHRPSRREELVAPALAAILFAVFAGKLGFQPVLLIDTVYIAILRMVHALLAGVYIGGAVAVLLLLARRAKLKQAVPYAPFLVAGTLLTLLIQQP